MKRHISSARSACSLPLLTLVALLLAPALHLPAAAQGPNPPDVPLGQTIPHRFEKAEIVEKLGDTIPLDLTFTDHRGQSVKLGDYFDGKRPVILNLGYYECPQLCSLVMNGIAKAVSDEQMAQFRPGPDQSFRIVTLTIDDGETPELAANKRTNYLVLAGLNPTSQADLDADEANPTWSFLTGSRKNIDDLCEATGFGYEYVPQSDQYAHQAAIIILSPDGKISRYLAGFNYDARQVRLALTDASAGKVGSLVDRALLGMCYAWDPDAGAFTANAFMLLRLAAGVTVLTLACLIGFMLWLERRKRNTRGNTPQANPSPSA